MLFRPNYCSNCGEKIDHAVWHFWTSRRFCDVCVTEHPVHEYAPKALVATSVLVILSGFTSYLGAGGSLNDRTPERRFERTALAAVQTKNVPAVVANQAAANQVATNQTAVSEPAAIASPPSAVQPVVQPVITNKVVSVESQYLCGAATKKGTPCSRKVKGNFRCYQHQGMPAIVSVDKLKLG